MREFRGKSISIKGEVEISKKEEKIFNIIGYCAIPVMTLSTIGVIPIIWCIMSWVVICSYMIFLAIKYFVFKKSPMTLEKFNNDEYEERVINTEEDNKNN